MARLTKKELERREEAKKRVESLLGDITIDDKEVVRVADKLDEIKSEESGEANSKHTSWLEKQIKELSDANKKLEEQLVVAKEDYKKLHNSMNGQTKSVSVSDSEVVSGVRRIFNDLNNNYLGNNREKRRYEQANIRPLLEKFLRTFPFLTKK